MGPGRHDHHRSSTRSRDRHYSDDWDRHHGYRTSGRSRSMERRKKDMHRPGHAVRDEYTPSLRSSSLGREGRDSRRYRDSERDYRNREDRIRKDMDRDYRNRARELEERERELREREERYRRERDQDYRGGRSRSDDDLDRIPRNDRYRDTLRSDYSRRPDDRYDTRRRGSREDLDRRDDFRDSPRSYDSAEKFEPIKAERTNTLSKSRRPDNGRDDDRVHRGSKRYPDNDKEVYERERSEKERAREREERENREREEQERREREEKERREEAERRRREQEEKERRNKEEKERRAKEEKERRAKEERERRENDERERREKEEHERREKEDRDRRVKEDRDRREKEERSRREKEERDREERDRRDREERERWEREQDDRDYEERIRREKEQYEHERRKAIEYENERMKERNFHEHQYNKEREVFEHDRYIETYEPPGYGNDYSWGGNSHRPIVVTQPHRRGKFSKTTKSVVRCCSVLHIFFCFCLAALSVVAWVFYNGLLAIGPFAALAACVLLAVFGFLSVMNRSSKFMVVVKFISIVCLLTLMVVMIVYCYLAGAYIGDPGFRYAYARPEVAYISVACLFILIPAWIGSIIFVYITCRHTCCMPDSEQDIRQNHEAVYYNNP